VTGETMSVLVQPRNSRSRVAAIFEMLDLTPLFNNSAFTFAHDLSDGGLNVWENSYPAEVLPPDRPIVEIEGIPFRLPPKESRQPDNVVCNGQMLDAPIDLYDWLYVLAAGERRTEDWVYLHCAGGSVDPEWLRISDFWPEAPARFGEKVAFRFPTLHYPRHIQQNLQPVMWRQRVPIARQEPLARIHLPENVAIHIFAATLVRATALSNGARTTSRRRATADTASRERSKT